MEGVVCGVPFTDENFIGREADLKHLNKSINELSATAGKQDKACLRSLALSFHSTLQRLPKLQQEIEMMLQSTDNFILC